MATSEMPQAGKEAHEERLRLLFPTYISDGTREALVALCRRASPNAAEQEAFAAQCLAYVRDFILRYPQVAEALFHGDELGGAAKQQRMHAKAQQLYTGRNIRRGELWNGAGEHTLAMGMLAEILAREMRLPPEAVTRVTLAGGVHDWWKKHEILRMWDAEDTLTAHGTPVAKETMESPAVVDAIRDAFDQAKDDQRDRLHALDFPDDAIALASANRLRDVSGPKTDEELIIFYLDHVLSGVMPISMRERIAKAVGGNPSYAAYEASFRPQLGGYTEHELLAAGLGQEIEQRLAACLGFTGYPEQLPEYITELFVQAVRHHR